MTPSVIPSSPSSSNRLLYHHRHAWKPAGCSPIFSKGQARAPKQPITSKVSGRDSEGTSRNVADEKFFDLATIKTSTCNNIFSAGPASLLFFLSPRSFHVMGRMRQRASIAVVANDIEKFALHFARVRNKMKNYVRILHTDRSRRVQHRPYVADI